MVQRVLDIIEWFQPQYWAFENPASGLLREARGRRASLAGRDLLQVREQIQEVDAHMDQPGEPLELAVPVHLPHPMRGDGRAQTPPNCPARLWRGGQTHSGGAVQHP